MMIPIEEEEQGHVKMLDAVPPYVHSQTVRRVYCLLTLQIALTSAVTAGFVALGPTPMYVPAFWGSMVLGTVLTCAFPAVKQTHPWNVVVFWSISLFESIVIGVLCSQVPTNTLLLSFVATSATFVALTLQEWLCPLTTEQVHVVYSASLATMVVCGTMVLGVLLFGPFPWTTVLVSSLGVVFVSGFVVYDTALLVRSKTPDDVLEITLLLYYDFLNLFLCMLNLLSGTRE